MVTLGIWKPRRTSGGGGGAGANSWTFNMVIPPATMASGKLFYGTAYQDASTVVYVSDFDSAGNNIGAALRAKALPGMTFTVTNTLDNRFWWRHEVSDTWEQAPGSLNIYINSLIGGYPIESACLVKLEFDVFE